MKETEKGRKIMLTAYAVPVFLLFFIGFVSTMILQIVANEKMSVVSGTVSLICMLLAVLAVMIFAVKRTADRLRGFTESLDQVAEGKLAGKEGKLAEQEGELEEIVNSMNDMTENFGRIITGVKSATASLREVSEDFTQSFQEMSSSMEQISSEVNAISEKTISQSVQTGEISSHIMEMSEAADGIAKQVKAFTGSFDHVKECGGAAIQIIDELASINETSGGAALEGYHQSGVVYQSAKHMQTVSEIISGICGQTNLLALNASIEASKAGEMGKGFALVAKEIQAFADHSRESLEQINGIVNELAECLNVSADVSKKVTAPLQRQAEKISKAKDIFTSLNREMEQVSGAVCEITKQAAAWKQAKEAIDGDMAALTRTAEENTASARQTLHAMEAFEEKVGECKETTEQVKTVSKELIDHIGGFKITDFRNG